MRVLFERGREMCPVDGSEDQMQSPHLARTDKFLASSPTALLGLEIGINSQIG
jgi:hypothetical protein